MLDLGGCVVSQFCTALVVRIEVHVDSLSPDAAVKVYLRVAQHLAGASSGHYDRHRQQRGRLFLGWFIDVGRNWLFGPRAVYAYQAASCRGVS